MDEHTDFTNEAAEPVELAATAFEYGAPATKPLAAVGMTKVPPQTIPPKRSI